ALRLRTGNLARRHLPCASWVLPLPDWTIRSRQDDAFTAAFHFLEAESGADFRVRRERHQSLGEWPVGAEAANRHRLPGFPAARPPHHLGKCRLALARDGKAGVGL